MELSTLYSEFLSSDGISIDTRSIRDNQIFFALPGERVDGNLFAHRAIEKGARLAVVSDQELANKNPKCIFFRDTLLVLQELAKWHRKTLDIPVIGITGSVAKTTTKELVNCVLESRYKTFATAGNLNNHIGVPLSILSINKSIEIAVIEMGANHIGEIRDLCTISMPNHGLITRIGHAHLEGFGGIEGVIVAKSDLYRYLRDHNGTAFINNNDPILQSLAKGFDMNKIFIHGELHSIVTKADPVLEISLSYHDKKAVLKTNIPGLYNLENIEAAIMIGIFFKIEWEEIINAIAGYKPKANRSEWIKMDTNDILLDAYNANPTSMSEAIKSFAEFNTPKKKVLILGEMKEMGDARIWAHNEIIEIIKKYSEKWFNVCLVGSSFKEVNNGSEFMVFENVSQAKEWFDKSNIEHAAILIKGSRSMAMEKILNTTIFGSEHG